MSRRPPGVDAEPSFAWLLDPLCVETFLDEVWAADHYHVKRSCPSYFDALLPAASRLDELLQMFRGEPSAVRLVMGSDKKGSESYRQADGRLDLDAVRNYFSDGYTVVLDGVEQYARPVAALARSLEVELHFPIQVNAYVTPPGRSGLAPHYDDHDVLILQLEGSKIWHLYVGVDLPPREIQRDREKAVDVDGLPSPTDVRLKAGDLLYVPRGRIHAAETAGEQSIHLTVGLHAPTVLMLVLGTLYSQSFRDDRLNARLPPRHLDNPEMAATLLGLVRDAVGTVQNPDAMTGGLGLLSDVLVKRGLCPPVGRVSDAKAVEAQTRVAKYQPLYSQAKDTGGGVSLQFASLSINAGSDHLTAMHFVSSSVEPFRVGDLPGLLPQQQIDLARTLILSGFLVRLPEAG